DPEQALLALRQLPAAAPVAEDVEHGQQRDLAGLRVPLVDAAAAQAHVLVVPRGDRAGGAGATADVEDRAVRRGGEPVGLTDLVEPAGGVLPGQPLDLVVRTDGGLAVAADDRSEERRVGKEGGGQCWAHHEEEDENREIAS